MSISKVKVVRLAHVHYAHPDLQRGVDFLLDFGMIEASREGQKVYLRGYGIQPYVYLAEQSPDDKRHFLGGYWAVESEAELQKAANLPNASPIKDLEGPGGGKVVTIVDPNGHVVGFVWGQQLRTHDMSTSEQVAGSLDKTGGDFNFAAQKTRKGSWRRFNVGPSPVHKLGHYGYMTRPEKLKETLKWYLDLINLKITDSMYDPVTGEDETCFMHIDLGQQYTDHHSFFLGSTPNTTKAHVHHSSFEVNDYDTELLGHDHLRKKGWTNCWGVGRHVLGSQIFDYWFDGSGNVVEHYSDGDMVNEDTPRGREPAAIDGIAVWGPNVTLGFATGRIEDAGKPFVAPPDVQHATPAVA
ncbi:hypothetical protein PV08_07635 [Exophiala spinifera]|uniref:VOC domain-containing protein n=1 Tax=Exophiala spinifera TaxID=91928 RepID=A0A0D2B837_9EURO|nr:uncharacterized protein PV08_07635 [Exophiala spinifera]KIW14850.1 hypothetical protein PV08_07635 [Exophiala spinifera]